MPLPICVYIARNSWRGHVAVLGQCSAARTLCFKSSVRFRAGFSRIILAHMAVAEAATEASRSKSTEGDGQAQGLHLQVMF